MNHLYLLLRPAYCFNFVLLTTVSVLCVTPTPKVCNPRQMTISLLDTVYKPCYVPYKLINCTGLRGIPTEPYLSPGLEFLSVRALNNSVAFCVGDLTDIGTSTKTTLHFKDSSLVSSFQIPVTPLLQGANSPPVIADLRATIPENAISGGWKVQFNVSDPDVWDKNNLKLYASYDMPLSVFQIEKIQSRFYLVFIGESDHLDVDSPDQEVIADVNRRELQGIQHFSFRVTAKDTSDARSSASVTITIMDFNDNKPYCPGLANRTINVSRVAYSSSQPIVHFKEACTDADRSDVNRIKSYLLLKQGNCEGAFQVSDEMLFPKMNLNLFEGPCHLLLLVADPSFNVTVPFTIWLTGCRAGNDSRGMYWKAANPGVTLQMVCPKQYVGNVSRTCSMASVYLAPKYRCTSLRISGLLWNVSTKPTFPPGAPVDAYDKHLLSALTSLSNLTKSDKRSLEEGDILDSRTILSIVGSEMTNMSSTAMASCVGIVNNLIASINTRPWRDIISTEGHGAERLFGIFDRYAQKALSSDLSNIKRALFLRRNLVMELGPSLDCDKTVHFPQSAISILGRSSLDEIKMACSAEEIGRPYSTVYYRNISEIVPVRSRVSNGSPNVSINAAVLSFTMFGKSSAETLTSPIEITFQMFNTSLSEPVCSYWSPSAGNGSGSWASDGCWVARSDSKTVTCACNHLTNFALLMSPGAAMADIHQTALSVISAVGCIISIIALVLTIILHGAFWQLARSDKSVLTMQLCSALLLAYLLFLVGVNRTETKALCTTIAVFLHFLYLVVFFLMLAEGLNLAIVIIFVFLSRKKNIVYWLTLQAWGLPLLIVVISMSATQLDGYGNSSFCWLSVDSGLIWAFIAPALLVIVLNMVIVVAVVRVMLRTAAVKSKSDKEKAKASVRSICVLLPITGGAWIIGVFSVYSSLVVFQYVFAVLNTLQGLFIFIFHCLLNKKIQQGFKQWQARRKRGYSQPGMSTKTGTISASNTNSVSASNTNSTAVSQL